MLMNVMNIIKVLKVSPRPCTSSITIGSRCGGRNYIANRESYNESLEFLPSLGLFIFGVKFTSTIRGKLD